GGDLFFGHRRAGYAGATTASPACGTSGAGSWGGAGRRSAGSTGCATRTASAATTLAGRAGGGFGVIGHQLGFAEPDLRHRLDEVVELHAREAIRDRSDLHAAEFRIDCGESAHRGNGGQSDFSYISSRVEHGGPFVTILLLRH